MNEEFLGVEFKPFTFSYSELNAATNDFNSSINLGEEEFGPVYMGSIGRSWIGQYVSTFAWGTKRSGLSSQGVVA
ncbi:probable LRR receptor-like serine/threonine-protein kinase At1g56130 isoform X2 [Humulus lupulus]|uniref:probable LRR receptor-like serine/threonine-protein kinase At1g56130 isoform X2 n=1 Tax=Humulus lupulus TaxID=3486 RepID=UPI002B40175B|nr:probable LRR receptor-like serine/threonine-protein kinase At1g56130 isoform X2 [Humulus lupulus]